METARDDLTLITEYLAGDREAFALLVRRHSPSVYRFVRGLLGEHAVAEDITQETFVKVWKHLRHFREDRPFTTWLFTIARNTTIDHLRKKRPLLFSQLSRTDESGVTLEFEATLPDTEPTPEEIVIMSEERERLEEALLQIPHHSREVLALHYEAGLTFDEIGEILGKPLHTVKSQHRRALGVLRDLLKEK